MRMIIMAAIVAALFGTAAHGQGGRIGASAHVLAPGRVQPGGEVRMEMSRVSAPLTVTFRSRPAWRWSPPTAAPHAASLCWAAAPPAPGAPASAASREAPASRWSG